MQKFEGSGIFCLRILRGPYDSHVTGDDVSRVTHFVCVLIMAPVDVKRTNRRLNEFLLATVDDVEVAFKYNILIL